MKLILYVCYCIFFIRTLTAQNSPVYHPIDNADWEKAVDGLSYTEEKEEVKTTDAPNIKPRNPIINTSPQFLQILLFIIIAAVLVFILLKLFGKGLFNNKKITVNATTTIQELEDRPMESDLERFLREAIEKRDYRLAIRIYFLILLKELHEKNFIEWKKNKTNMDYLSEVHSHPAYLQLSNNTLLYEFFWYGEKQLAEEQFNVVRVSFVDLINKLKGNK